MLHINDATNEIQLTRGDTAYLQVPLVNIGPGGEETEYAMAADDILTFTVRAALDDPKICFQKVSKGANSFRVAPEDTQGYTFGKYKYDIQLTKANGDVHTVVEPACFKILPEVTY